MSAVVKEQKFAEAFAMGQPGGGKIELTLFRDKLNELI